MIKKISFNRKILLWSTFVSILFAYLGVIVLSKTGTPNDPFIARLMVIANFSLVLGFSSSTAATSIASLFVTQSASFGYIFKHTRIKKWNYILSFIAGSFPLFLINAAILLIFVTLLVKIRVGSLSFPASPLFSIPMIMILALAYGVLFTTFAIVVFSISIICSNRNAIVYTRYIPLLVFVIVYFLIVNGVHYISVYLLPFLSLDYIIYFAYTGSIIFPISVVIPFKINLELASLSILSGILLLVSIMYILSDRIYERNHRE